MPRQPTYAPTASARDMLEKVGAMRSDTPFSHLPMLVIAEDGRSRPVVAFDFFEDRDRDGNLQGRAFVVVTGSPDDPHPMWMSGYFKALAAHERADARDPA